MAVSENFDYLKLAGSEVFPADELPDAIQPLYSTIWRPRGESHIVTSKDLKVKVFKREDHEHIPPQIPGFRDMIDQGMTYQQALGAIMSDPEIINHIVPGVTIDSHG